MSPTARPSTPALIAAGLAALRREPGLVAMRWLGDMAAVALAAAGTAAPAWALFGARFAERFAPLGRARDADAAAEALVDLYLAAAGAPGRLLAGLAVMVALWTLAFVVYCWVQGGFYGVLVAGDRAAGARGAFSVGTFAAAGVRRFWRFFWFVNLYATVIGLIALVALLPLLLVPAAEPGELPVAALAVLAAMTPPAALAAAAAAIWYALGRADLARAGSGTWPAARRAVTAMRRHPVPVLLTALVAVAAGLTVSGVGAVLGRGVAALGQIAGVAAAVAGGAAVAAAQGLAVTAVATAHAAAMVRLMAHEGPAGEGA